jgi:polyhydroxyalkanoate synthesis regulator phasin
MNFMSKIWGLEELVAEGKITQKQADKVMKDFIIRAIKIEEEECSAFMCMLQKKMLRKFLKD